MKVTTRHGNSAILLMLTVCAAVALSGCTSITNGKSTWKKLPWMSEKEEEPYPNPRKMAVTWTPDVIMRTGSTPTRGFGGRVFFYDEKTRPVPVDGELAVQAYVPGPDGKPVVMQRYGFTAEQFTRHYSQTDLGASYSIWIPWDAVGGDEQKITLIPSFRTKEGKVVNGTASVVLLPGKNERSQNQQFSPPNGQGLVQGTSGRSGPWSSANSTPELFRQSGLTTTTIPVGQVNRGNPLFAPGIGLARQPAAGRQRTTTPAPPSAMPPMMPQGVQPASATMPMPATTGPTGP